jgi:hypothetical protein
MKNLHLIGLLSLVVLSTQAEAQIFVANSNGTIGEYNANGTVVNASLISGLANDEPANGGPVTGPSGLAVETTSNGYDVFASDSQNGNIYEYAVAGGTASSPTLIGNVSPNDPSSLAISGNTLYVADDGSGNVLSYNLAGATPVQSTIITGLTTTGTSPRSIALGGSNLYITNLDGSSTGVKEYVAGQSGTTATSVVNASYPIGLTISGTTMFITNNLNGSILEYTLSGTNDSTATLKSSFAVSGLSNPIGLAVDGNDLLVGDFNRGTISAYSIPGNGSLDTSFTTITGLTNPEEIVDVESVPEPSSLALCFIAFGCLLLRYRAHRA